MLPTQGIEQRLHLLQVGGVKALEQLDDLTYESPLFKGKQISIWPRPVQSCQRSSRSPPREA